METDPASKLQVFLSRMKHFLRRISYAHLAITQGIFYFAGGLWPFISLNSFLTVTGPKTDIWLVRTTGLLLMVIGGVLFSAGVRWRISVEMFMLAVGSAAALAGIEIFNVAAKRISPIYLLDALVEITFIALWISVRVRGIPVHENGMIFDPTLIQPKGDGERE